MCLSTISARMKDDMPDSLTTPHGAPAPNDPRRGGRRLRLVILALIIAAVAALRLSGVTQYLDQAYLREFIQQAGMLAPVIFMLIYTVAPALMLPGLPLTVLSGVLFGPFWGVVYAIVGATAGASLAFLIARYAARDWVAGKLTNARLLKLDDEVRRQGWKVVAFTRLIPLFPFNLLNYAFGLTSIGFIPYAVTSFICMLPGCIAYVVFSSSLLDVLHGKVSPALIIGLALIAVMALIPWFYKRRRSGASGAGSSQGVLKE